MASLTTGLLLSTLSSLPPPEDLAFLASSEAPFSSSGDSSSGYL